MKVYTKEDVYVGRKVYLKAGINKSRYEKGIKEDVISKVGRKYFELEGCPKTRYHIDTLEEDTEYCESYYIYFNKQQILDEKETYKLLSNIKSAFGIYSKNNFTLKQLREINKIIESGEE